MADYSTLQCFRARDALEMRVRQGSAKGGTAVHLVHDVLQFDLPIAARYKYLDVLRILQDNCSETGPGLDALIHGLNILERYGKNLLRSDRPSQWRVVRLSNSIFKMEVDVIKGAREILKLLGYTKLVDDGLSYPDECLIPEIPTIASVTADILLLRQELLMIARKEHPQEKDFFPYIPVEEIRQLQAFHQQQSSSRKSEPPPASPMVTESFNQSASLHIARPPPPTYEDILLGAGTTIQVQAKPVSNLQDHSPITISAHGSSSSSHEPMHLEPADEIAEDELCDICGQTRSSVRCRKCDKIFCPACDQIWHNNPKRKNHTREQWKLERPVDTVFEREPTNAPNSYENTFLNGMTEDHSLPPTGQMETMQGGQGNEGSQPTISGARLKPSLGGRMPSVNDNDCEWTRKANRMAAELMDIDNSEARIKKLMSSLKDLDHASEKYKSGIKNVQRKGGEKPSLAAHWQEKLQKIEDLKAQLKFLCGYEEPMNTASLTSSANDNEYLNSVDNSEGRWSFKSSKSQDEAGSILKLNDNGEFHSLASPSQTSHGWNGDLAGSRTHSLQSSHVKNAERPRLEETQVPVANLIDLSPTTMVPTASATNASEQGFTFPNNNDLPLDLRLLSEQPMYTDKAISPGEILDDVTFAKTTVGAGGDHFAETELNPTAANTAHSTFVQPGKTPSALENPELQSIFSSMEVAPAEPSTHGNLKRILSHEQNGTSQPAKLYRGDNDDKEITAHPAQRVPEIASKLSNLNIQSLASPVSSTFQAIAVRSHEFSEPRSRLENYDEFSQLSYEDAKPGHSTGGTMNVSNIVHNRLEASGFRINEGLFEALSTEALQNRIKKEKDRLQTTQFLYWIRAGDSSNFQPELVKFAVTELDGEGNLARFTPNSWLERKWRPNVESFIEFAKEKGFKIHFADAEKVLIDGDNSFEKSLKLICDEQDEQVMELGEEYGHENARKSLLQSKGDSYQAGCLLQKGDLKELFEEFSEKESEDMADVEHIKRTMDIIDDDTRRLHSYCATFTFFERTMYAETFSALLGVMSTNDMQNVLIGDVVEAVTNYPGDMDGALRYLDNECMICTDKFPRSKITCLPACGDRECMYCVTCLEQHLTICITDKNIRDIVCPVCSQPEIKSDEETMTNFFNHIDVILRGMEDKRIHEIFQQKLRDFTLMRMPNFRWCSHCSGGFQYEIEREHDLKMVCPFCQKATCYKCKKHWEAQHEGISCEQFQLWKESNDPEFQAAGLARHLKENGIDCPDCNFRYALAKGGCMHFKCTQCSHEFCSGCNSPFKHGRACNMLSSCHSKGLHAHHPRDCLFYLRDTDPEMLKRLLKKNKVPFNTDGPQTDICQVMEQKETPAGMKDDICGREVKRGYSGLCRLHYNEYLVNLVNSHHLDPADVFSIEQLKPCLMREDKVVPRRLGRESDEAYRKRLLTEVKKLPLIQERRQAVENAV